MKEVKYIKIRQCNNCHPVLWTPIRKSVGVYKCDSCHSVVTQVLEYTGKKEVMEDEG